MYVVKDKLYNSTDFANIKTRYYRKRNTTKKQRKKHGKVYQRPQKSHPDLADRP